MGKCQRLVGFDLIHKILLLIDLTAFKDSSKTFEQKLANPKRARL